ncbi:polysaccharide biosynthesis/export family protein [Engelhardtia mirabilis]|uniref:Polysaccharide biosynthesis/export protein n=1 Tax=Engelhardtia mirabilis TaxID=2528011 RepID=A0A518BKC7_9BACT|nr:Polysaccharide biosynthesis/export protein [Planctomycetes bacterium Pla133]QDV01752.1 Polysaccharide biosynthesis/export protein [Planctomycetes bacterium Pla86]
MRSPNTGLLLLLLAALFASGCAATPDKRILQYLNTHGFGSRYTGNAEEENYVSLGDSFVWTDEYDPTLSGTGRVDIDGTIVLPQVGAVAVAGMTRSEIEAFLTQKLARFYPRVDIKIASFTVKGKVFFIFGEVGSEGARPFPGNLTVFEAVMAAKPVQYRSNLGRVRLVRGDPRDPIIMTVNIRDIMNGDTTFNVLVQERDIIIVPPTILSQIGNFLAALVQPFTSVLTQITSSLYSFNRLNSFGAVGANNNKNNNFNLF